MSKITGLLLQIKRGYLQKFTVARIWFT